MKKNKVNNKMIFQVVTISFFSLLLSFILFVLIMIFVVRIFDLTIEFPNHHPGHEGQYKGIYIIFISLVISFILGVIFSVYLSERFLKPIKKLKKMTGEVAKGNFNVQIDKKDIPENELGELIENFNKMVKELNKNEMLKSDFIGNVSHEFKTPLSVIQGYTTLLQDENLSDNDKTKYTTIILEATKRLTTLVNDILKISKIENQKVSVVYENFSLDEQIRESILSYETLWNEKQIEFDIILEEININSDKNLLFNVWNNLINNAIKFSNFGGKIEISLASENENAVFKIKDYGCGISKDDLPYIFDKFYQVDKSHNSNGNGLGLALVKKIIEYFNGSINVESKLNEGTTFIVTLKK